MKITNIAIRWRARYRRGRRRTGGRRNHGAGRRHHQVGVLHSLSGTMAISETTLKDTVLMLIDEQNKKAACSARSSRRSSSTRLELATVRREGSAAAGEGQGIGSIRLLDLGIA